MFSPQSSRARRQSHNPSSICHTTLCNQLPVLTSKFHDDQSTDQNQSHTTPRLLQVSGLDAATDELLSNAREGLADSFGLANVEAVTVGAAGTLDSDNDDDDFVVDVDGAADDADGVVGAETVTGGDGESLQRRRRRRRRAQSERERAANVNLRRNTRQTVYLSEAKADVGVGVGGDVGVFAGGYRSRRRWLQEEEEEEEDDDDDAGETVDIDFEVAIPEDELSPAARVAAVVNSYADGGVYALADTLRVDPMDIRCLPLSALLCSCCAGSLVFVLPLHYSCTYRVYVAIHDPQL